MVDEYRNPDDVLAFALWPENPEPQARQSAPLSPQDPPGKHRPRQRQQTRFLLRVAIVLAACIVAVGLAALYLSTLHWTQPHQSPVATTLLKIQIIGGAIPTIVELLCLALLVALCLRHPTRRFVLASGIGVGVGVIAAIIVLVVATVTDAFGVVLSAGVWAWTIGSFAVLGLGLANLFATRGWRLAVAPVLVIAAAIAGTLGINAQFGLDPTVGGLAGISTTPVISLPTTKPTPTPTPTATPLDGGALWANWTAPAGMPTYGVIHSIEIPGTISGFKARPAGLYMPPAALVPNAPALPLVIMMMGQPGNPDPSFQREVLDPFTTAHHGLGPIVIVADQIGNPSVDPLCTNDTRYGNAETYVTQDVVNWARTHLHILQNPQDWTIAGYSNGGECALSFGVQFPGIWGNVLDISGEDYPGSDDAAVTLARDFHGNEAAYQATWPLKLITSHVYPNTVGIFTVSTNDPYYLPQAKTAAAAATKAGWKTTYFEIVNGGHVLGALLGGLTEGYKVLYPRLGLSDPSAG